jgi:DeoR/GlpR family transcriptional regulator of sugar metabolism
MTKTELRRKAILNIVSREEANVEALSRHFDVSESTIRRDLAQLADRGRILRTYGGAALQLDHRAEATANERIGINHTQKNAIGRLAASLVHDGDTIILDNGTTIAAMATFLPGKRDVHVITNNLMILPTLAVDDGIAVTLLGGTLRKMSMGTVGALAELSLNRMTADKLFLGADGLVAGRGLCEANMDQVALKSKMMEQAATVIVLADASKLGSAVQQAWAPLERPWTLLTDAGATPAQLAPFQALPYVTVLIADAEK